jgi:hypothetical protein
MNAIEQLYAEADEQAGSPEGFLRLVHLILAEADKVVDWSTDEAKSVYRSLLRVYVMAKRKAAHWKNNYDSTLASQYMSIQRLVKVKRAEARKYGANLPTEHQWEIKQEVGRNIGLGRPTRVTQIVSQSRPETIEDADGFPYRPDRPRYQKGVCY